MNLLIFLDLTYNPGKNFNFYSLQGQCPNFSYFYLYPGQNFLDVTHSPGGAHVYLVSTASGPLHPEGPFEFHD